MNRWASALVLAVTILAVTILLASPVRAGAPVLVAETTTPGGTLRPVTDAPVAVLQADVHLDLRSHEGRIRSVYRLKNRDVHPLDLSIAFPAPPWVMGQWKVGATLDGQAYPIRNSLGPVAQAEDELTLQPTWLDPFTGEPYFPVKLSEPQAPQFLVFPVSFTPGQERVLAVEYLQFPGEDPGRLLGAVRRFDYLLQPASHWEKLDHLTIEVLAPEGVPLHSTIPLTPRGQGRYEAAFDGLPGGNLSVFVAPGKGPRWWWDRSGRGWSLALLAAVTGLLAGLAALSYRSWVRRAAGLPFSLLTFVALYLVAPPHLLRPDPTGVMFLWLLLIPALMVLHILVRSLTVRIGERVSDRWMGAGF